MALYLTIIPGKTRLHVLRRQLHRLGTHIRPMLRGTLRDASWLTRHTMIGLLAQRMDIPERFLHSSIRVDFSELPHLISRIEAARRRHHVIYMDAVQTAHGVTYQGAHGRRLIAHAFIAKKRTGRAAVFRRRGAARLPIIEQVKPSAAEALASNPDIADNSFAAAAERAWRRLLADLEAEIADLEREL